MKSCLCDIQKVNFREIVVFQIPLRGAVINLIGLMKISLCLLVLIGLFISIYIFNYRQLNDCLSWCGGEGYFITFTPSEELECKQNCYQKTLLAPLLHFACNTLCVPLDYVTKCSKSNMCKWVWLSKRVSPKNYVKLKYGYESTRKWVQSTFNQLQYIFF